MKNWRGLDAEAPVTDKQRGLLDKKLDDVRNQPVVYAVFMPRGIGLSALTNDERHITQARRRFMLLGQTMAGMQVWDVRRAVRAMRELGYEKPLVLWGYGETASHVALASLYEKGIGQLHLSGYPKNDKEQPDYLNISRVVTPADVLDLAREKTKVNVSK